jgi:hypothetical protein
MWVLVSNTAIIGGLDKTAPFWKEMVEASLKAQGKTLEWFNAEVASDIADMADTLDDFIKEKGA